MDDAYNDGKERLNVAFMYVLGRVFSMIRFPSC